MIKKLAFLFPLVLCTCKKQLPAVQQNAYAVEVSNNFHENYPPKDSLSKKDSLVNVSAETKNISTVDVQRSENGDTITRTADRSALPLIISENFERNGQTLVIKIKDFKKNKISIALDPKNSGQNIRINQIFLNGKNADGPFGREIKDYPLHRNGEIRIVIGRSNMASGRDSGVFGVTVK